MTKQEYVLLVAERLRELAEAGSYARHGICSTINMGFSRRFDWSLVFLEWPKTSGHSECPVPAPAPSMTPCGAYSFLPLWQGEYGESRRDLADFMADWLEENIEELCA